MIQLQLYENTLLHLTEKKAVRFHVLTLFMLNASTDTIMKTFFQDHLLSWSVLTTRIGLLGGPSPLTVEANTVML